MFVAVLISAVVLVSLSWRRPVAQRLALSPYNLQPVYGAGFESINQGNFFTSPMRSHTSAEDSFTRVSSISVNFSQLLRITVTGDQYQPAQPAQPAQPKAREGRDIFPQLAWDQLTGNSSRHSREDKRKRRLVYSNVL
ncbi:hypothetical protein RRG08_013593 [Elysia crispata]|uniref:Uncharacterized protein n=1 Tax=Elysia crispata TaxID=231223 RepID=A0AAE0Y246_9GAST|nr:hypothetical protein RRG08_013593 [Elysia crispata]